MTRYDRYDAVSVVVANERGGACAGDSACTLTAEGWLWIVVCSHGGWAQTCTDVEHAERMARLWNREAPSCSPHRVARATIDEQVTAERGLVEAVSRAMAASEGNRYQQDRAILNNYDALGYTALAEAAVAELERLGRLAGPTSTDSTAGAVSEPFSDLSAVPSRGVAAT